MSDNKSPMKGYYSILQYVPDIERFEGANIGIVLFCPEIGYLKARTATSNDRVRRFFGPEENINLDIDRLNVLKLSFEERIESEASRIKTIDEFTRFIKTRANQLLLTDARLATVFDPNVELAVLFDTLVGSRRKRVSKQDSSTKEELIQLFSDALTKKGIAEKVQRDIRIQSKILDRTLIFPFAFQNGHMNVIEPVTFDANKEHNINRACQLAIEGNDLWQQEQVKLNVFASFKLSELDSGTSVKSLLNKYDVALRTTDELDELVNEIAHTSR